MAFFSSIWLFTSLNTKVRENSKQTREKKLRKENKSKSQKMESATSKFLKNCTKIIPTNDVNLTLHYRSHLQNYQGLTDNHLKAQNEHYSSDKNKIQQVRGKNGEIECKFCFVKSIPKFKVQRLRKKGDKRVTKVAVYQCRKCHKRTISKETLPNLDRSKSKQTKQVSFISTLYILYL